MPLPEMAEASVEFQPRRDGRVVEGARLESVFRGNSNVGSNPTLSAILESILYRRIARREEISPPHVSGLPPGIPTTFICWSSPNSGDWGRHRRLVRPVYPPNARRARIQGIVKIRAQGFW